tara:strand:- start:711 stop:1811 length:1101 start_codon:yes stop_codon:yes gene_type:complete
MKIVFDSKIFLNQRFGGPSRYFFNLFENLNLLDVNSFIVSPIYYNEYIKSSKFKKNIYGINFLKLKFMGPIFNKIDTTFSDHFIKKIKPDIIHTTDYFKSNLDKGKPLVVTVHDLTHEIYYHEYGRNKDFRPKERILDLADSIICVSKNTKKDLLKFYHINEKKIKVIYHGNNLNDIKKDLKKKSNYLDFKYFLYVGGRKRYKNFFSIIDVFKKNKQIYNEFKIVCFGGGQLLNSEKKVLVEKNIDLSKIIFFPDQDDQILFDLYKNATALIYPSLNEGFGMPILEAMSLGCPVVSSNTSSLPEVYGEAALSFCPLSHSELLNNLEKIAFESELRKKLITSGLKQSLKFSWKNCANETLSVYKKLI